jgi:hypothetical protein
MRKLLLGVILALLGTTANAQNTISLGANILSPAISGQYQLSERSVVRMDVGFFLSDNSAITLNPQLLFHKGNNSYTMEDVGIIMPYHGPGLVLGLNSSENIYAFEFVWGFELDLYEFPIEVFIDAGPSYLFSENNNALSLTSSFGVRYKF